MDAKMKQSQQDYEKVVEQFERAIPTKKCHLHTQQQEQFNNKIPKFPTRQKQNFFEPGTKMSEIIKLENGG